MSQAPNDEGHGTVTLTLNVETTLADLTNPKTYVGYVDLTNMQAGDITALQIYIKVLTGGSLRSLYYQQFFDAQTAGNIAVVTLPVASLYEWKFTIQQTAGTARSYDWQAISL